MPWTEGFSKTQRSFVRKTLAGHDAFVPPPVPRDLLLDAQVIAALSKADRALGELSGVGRRLRDPRMLIRPYVKREAVLSSRIEGTQSSLSDLLLFEADAATPRPGDAREVSNYVHALESGIRRLASLPISLRLVLSLHRILMTGVRGENRTPGRFRTTQNWIAPHGTPIEDAMFVPPPPEELMPALDDWEKHIHEVDLTPPLIRCALMHYQFETIHPFTDGNGRLGRLLMPLFLIQRECLSQPLLYLSAFFETHRAAYYEALTEGRRRGDLTPWLLLFLEAVAVQSVDAASRADELTALEREFRGLIRTSRSRVTHALIDELFTSMFVTASRVAEGQHVTPVSARAAIGELVGAGILREVTGGNYRRVYVSPQIVEIVDRPVVRGQRRSPASASNDRCSRLTPGAPRGQPRVRARSGRARPRSTRRRPRAA